MFVLISLLSFLPKSSVHQLSSMFSGSSDVVSISMSCTHLRDEQACFLFCLSVYIYNCVYLRVYEFVYQSLDFIVQEILDWDQMMTKKYGEIISKKILRAFLMDHTVQTLGILFDLTLHRFLIDYLRYRHHNINGTYHPF